MTSHVFVALLYPWSDSWVNWKLLKVSGWDQGGALLFGMNAECGLADVPDDEIDANGFCKWDGCREFEVKSHECSDAAADALLSAVLLTMRLAASRAGYGGDDA